MGVDIKLHSEILPLLDVELLDTVLSEDTEKTLARILTRNFYHIVLRHPVVSSTCRDTTLGGQYCDDSTC